MENGYKLIPKFGLGSSVKKAAKIVAKNSKGAAKKVRPSPAYERVRYSKYSVDATNPKERELVAQHWKARYPDSGIKFQNPEEITIGFDGDKVLKIGELPLSSEGKYIADLMEKRMSKYKFREGLDPQYITTAGRTSTSGLSGFMKQLKNETSTVYMPLRNAENIEGQYFAGKGYLKLNPWRSKPYRFSQIHEGLSHATDDVVKEMRTASGKKILGSTYKDSLGKTHVEGSYGKIAWPEDLFNPEDLEKLVSKSSRKAIEARATNWEMVTDLYEQLAKYKGITFEEAIHLPESEFNNFVEKALDSPDKLATFMEKFDNKYLADYAKVLRSGNSMQQGAYSNRIIRMIQKAPSYVIPTILGSSILYNMN